MTYVLFTPYNSHNIIKVVARVKYIDSQGDYHTEVDTSIDNILMGIVRKENATEVSEEVYERYIKLKEEINKLH